MSERQAESGFRQLRQIDIQHHHIFTTPHAQLQFRSFECRDVSVHGFQFEEVSSFS